MSLVKFMDRVERGLREYFKGNAANATEADFYISQTAMDNSPQISISGRVHANGRVTLERCYLDAERGEALMKLISEIK